MSYPASPSPSIFSTAMASCTHKQLRFGSASGMKTKHSYQQPSWEEIRNALRVSSASDDPAKDVKLPSKQTFPAPLVEKGDDLYHNPEYPPQSLQEWAKEGARNKVTTKRRTIYVVPPSEIADEVDFMAGWTSPQFPRKRKAAALRDDESSADGEEAAQAPCVEDVAEYLRAFYHGLPVKVLGQEGRALRFTRWDDGARSTRQTPKQVVLETGKEAVRIRCRPSPDKLFKGQLNLNDVLDVAIGGLPADAYAMVMLVHHDLYEDEDDDFCCGRAYGGNRVAVVSSARYQPDLDSRQDIDREHSWPASHCRVTSAWSAKISSLPVVSSMTVSEMYPYSAIAAAVDAVNTLSPPITKADLSALWLGRVCKTTAHEIGHCFGIDHCTYYACIMQGTANIAEDSRQPPYLCPVDLAKILRATDGTESQHYNAMLQFCERRADDRMFAAFAAWTRFQVDQPGVL